MDEEELKRTTLNTTDIVEALSYLLDLAAGNEKSSRHPEIDVKMDDIDHLGNRRIRPVGELVANQCRIALARMDRYIKDRMTNQTTTQQQEVPLPEKLVNPRILSNLMRDFFGRSQLSQFMAGSLGSLVAGIRRSEDTHKAVVDAQKLLLEIRAFQSPFNK